MQRRWSCLQDWIAKTRPKTCYQTAAVDLNTRQTKAPSSDAFNVRFDMYKGSLNYSADYAPSVNVRKGFLPNNSGNWCSSGAANPYYTTQPTEANSIVTTTGDTQNGNATARQTIINVPSANVTKIAGMQLNPTGNLHPVMISDPSNAKNSHRHQCP